MQRGGTHRVAAVEQHQLAAGLEGDDVAEAGVEAHAVGDVEDAAPARAALRDVVVGSAVPDVVGVVGEGTCHAVHRGAPRRDGQPAGRPVLRRYRCDMSQAAVDAQVAALAARLVPQVPRLARRVVERIRAEVPGFDRLPSEVQDVEVAATARAAIRAFLEHAQGLPGRDTGLSRRRAVQRAEEGVPLAALVQTYSVGAEVVVDALAEAAVPGEEAALLRLTREQLRAVGAAVTQVTEAYLTGADGQHVAVRELTWALLRGEGPEDVAARYGLPLESGYLVLRVRGTVDGDPTAARSALRWVLAHAAPRADGRALSLRDDLGGFVLLPASFPVEELVRRFPAADGVAPVVGAAPGVLAGGRAGGRRAGRPDRRRGRPPGGAPARRRAAGVPPHPPGRQRHGTRGGAGPAVRAR